MLKIVFLFFAIASCFKTAECYHCTPTQYSKSPDVGISIETFKNSTGHCKSKTRFEINEDTIGKYQINVEKYSTNDEQFLTNAGIYVLEEMSEIRQELKPFRTDYKLYPNIGFYKFHEEPLTWPNARRKCVEEGAHLAVINSEKEADTIIQLIALYPLDKLTVKYGFVLLGFHDYFIDGEFLTVFGDPLENAGYIKWRTGEPSSGTAENCGSMSRIKPEFNDFPCQLAATFICEKEIEYHIVSKNV